MSEEKRIIEPFEPKVVKEDDFVNAKEYQPNIIDLLSRIADELRQGNELRQRELEDHEELGKEFVAIINTLTSLNLSQTVSTLQPQTQTAQPQPMQMYSDNKPVISEKATPWKPSKSFATSGIEFCFERDATAADVEKARAKQGEMWLLTDDQGRSTIFRKAAKR